MGVNVIDVGLKFKSALQYRSRTDYFVLHHAEASNATVQDIHQWHLNNGWAGIGYHYYVRKDGSIYRGRPRDTIGAHCQGHNYDSIGICAEGNYMAETMPEAQKSSIIALCKELLTIYPNVQIVGHRDLYSTQCPGTDYPFQEIKTRIYQKEVIPMVGPFTDVPNDHWAAQAILDMYNRGLLSVDAKNPVFRPDDPITRAEAAALFDRVLKYLGK
jgi:hypothetical protein